jgi:prepilin-type N-terminal cleavage/methylation domain-containing protein
MKKNGFTIIELIVSVAIISLVTGIFLANYSSANRRTDLTMTAQKLVSDIRLAQSYALGLARYGSSGATHVPIGGWGIYFNLINLGTDRYMIFADDNADTYYSSGEAAETYGGQTVYLPKNIIIQSMQVASTGTDKVNVTFLPPDPVTNINNGVATGTSAVIVLKDVKTNSLKTIRINFLGLIEVLD